MKIVVIGALGQLGMDVCQILQKDSIDPVKLDIGDLDISIMDSTKNLLMNIKPDIVVNTAAFHNVPKCEDEPKRAFEVNGLGSKNLAELSNDLDFYLVHISTDYVFDGKKEKPYIESDRPVPLNVYANTKLSGELFIESIAKRYIIMRTSGIYGKNPCRAKGGVNFVDLMLKFAIEKDEIRVVDDEILTPTSTVEVARQIAKVVKKQPIGLAHATAEGFCSWFEFARKIFEIKGLNINLNKALPGEFAIKVNRPKYSVLENRFLKDNNINNFRSWEDGLTEYLNH